MFLPSLWTIIVILSSLSFALILPPFLLKLKTLLVTNRINKLEKAHEAQTKAKKQIKEKGKKNDVLFESPAMGTSSKKVDPCISNDHKKQKKDQFVIYHVLD